MQPSVRSLVLYLWITTFLLLVLFWGIKQFLGTKHMFGGEFLWLAIAPLVVGSLYRRKYKRLIPEETAKKVANYFVATVVLGSLVVVSSYVSQNWSPRLSDNFTFLIVAMAIYFGVLWFLGRWIVLMALGLNYYGRNTKEEP